MFQMLFFDIAVLKLVLLAGNDPASFGYQPRALPLSYKRFEIGRANGNWTRVFDSTDRRNNHYTIALFEIGNGDGDWTRGLHVESVTI